VGAPSDVAHVFDRGRPWFGFEAVRGLDGLPEEILFVPLPGHTMGHYGVAVESESGWLLDAGDAFFDPREVLPEPRCAFRVRLFEEIVTTDRSMRVHNQARLRRLIAGRPEIEVFAAHDPGAVRRLASSLSHSR
jgi:glyoxylase-like metal-dependent hydrolase (beta-lactamase superfamily II)